MPEKKEGICLIEIRNLSKLYNGKIAINNISLSLKKGEIVGILGSNGAGKTTLMNLITGYVSMTSGDVFINGHHVLENPELTKAKLGYLPDTPPLYEEMTVNEYLKFVAQLKKINKAKMKDEINAKLEKLNLVHVQNRLIKSLSKGYKQRVGIAQAILGNLPLIVLDEPTSGLDPKELIEIRKTIKELKETSLVLISSHILSEINSICSKIVVIENGEIVSEGAVDLHSGTTNDSESKLFIRIKGDNDKIQSLFQEINGLIKVDLLPCIESGCNDYYLTYESEKDIREAIFWKLSENDLPILTINKQEESLEELFMQLTLKKKEDIK